MLVGSGRSIEWVRSTPVVDLVATYQALMAWQSQEELKQFRANRYAGASESEEIEKYIKNREQISEQ